ncbi:MAG TPA: hypothetical protein VFB84_21750 [Micromonosporaceae bacterium]|nr:hypothetical protein [Micromonosporaceae bacterium]
MEGRTKVIAALLGLLTAVVVLLGSLTNQGWLPSPIKEPVQEMVPGAQPGEPARDAQPDPLQVPADRKEAGSAQRPGSRVSPTGGAYGPDTCVQGYVWREAVPGDHVCVTPQTRDQTWEDNGLADSRRSPTGGDYGPDTCIQGYVWREAVADDHVCVTPETRAQAQADNQLASSRVDR